MSAVTLQIATLHEALFAAGAAEPAKAAIITPAGAQISYADFIRQVRTGAALITRRARGPGPAVLLAGDDHDAGAGFLAAFFAACAAGRPAFVLPAERMAPAWGRCEDQPAVIITQGEHETQNVGLPRIGIDEIIAGEAGGDPPSLPSPGSDSEFLWGLTSGTTGAAKLFARTHRSWLASFAAADSVFDIRPSDRVGIIGALDHSLFLYGAVHALCRGLSVVLCGGFRPRGVLTHLITHRVSLLYGVPAMLDALYRAGLGEARGLLRRVLLGGAALSSGLRARLEHSLPETDIAAFYGASELSFVSYESTRAPAPPGSAGRLFPGVRLALGAPPEDRDAGGQRREPGLIYVSSPMLFACYVGADGGGPVNGWASAGDIGWLDSAGFLYLTGRAARVINSKGLKLQAETIEQVLADHDGVGSAAVFGLADERRGERIAAVIVPRAGRSLERRALAAHCRASLGAHGVPHVFFLAEALPMTRSGKIALATLAAEVRRGDAAFQELG